MEEVEPVRQAAQRHFPDQPDVLIIEAKSAEFVEDRRKAKLLLRPLQTTFPKIIDIYHYRYRLLAELGDVDEIEELTGEVCRQFPDAWAFYRHAEADLI